MNKLLKFIPAMLVTVVATTGCGSKNKLQSFVDGLKDGEVTEEQLEGIYAEGVLSSGDSLVKFAQYSATDYNPYWSIGSGQEEEYYEQYVHDLTEKESYRAYDDNTVVTTIEHVNYPYDKSQVIDEDSEGLSKTATKYSGKAHIYEKEGKLNYTYTQDNSAENDYSFTYAVDSNAKLKEHFVQGGGFSENLIAGIADVKDTYDYYAGAITWCQPVETLTASKKDGKLTVRYTGDFNYDLYSAERYWGWTYADDDTEYANPLVHETTDYDGMYVQMGIRFEYGYSIENGIISSAHMYYFSYFRILYADKNHKAGDPVPEVELSKDYIAGLDLYIPEKITLDGKETVNPYTGVGYLTALPNTTEGYSASAKSLGNYDASNLPDSSKYRARDAFDTGCWFDVSEMDVEY